MRASLTLSLVLLTGLATAQHVAREPASGEGSLLPLASPRRGFLLLDAERTVVPGRPASVHVQLRGGGPLRLSVFQVEDPLALVRRPPAPDGLALAQGPYGAAAERLVAQGQIGRRDGGLALRADRTVNLVATPPRDAVSDEQDAYDNTDDALSGVETRWVRAGAWADTEVPLGPLPEGVYLVQARAGAFVAHTLVNVSALVTLLRRGDARDVAVVADAQGVPQTGVSVRAYGDDAQPVVRQSDAAGLVAWPAQESVSVQVVAHRGQSWAWARANHARLALCDTRVYLDVGRPAFRVNERLHVRGHLRGCSGQEEGPLAHRRVTLFNEASAAEGVSVESDARGDFEAELAVRSTYLGAAVDGARHVRTITLDSRALPARALRVDVDRAVASSGDEVTVRVSDDAGGWPWPAAVTVTLFGQSVRSMVGPGQPGTARFRVPAMREVLRREVVHALLSMPGHMVTAETQLWVGHAARVLEVRALTALGRTGEPAAVQIRAEDLAGRQVEQQVRVEVLGSDGNRPVGAVRWASALRLAAGAGAAAPQYEVSLPGEGPWWVRARSLDSAAVEASTVIWDRLRRPAMGGPGLQIQSQETARVAGESLGFVMSRPARGATWVTFEQSGVLASRWVASLGSASPSRWEMALPEGARGGVSLVATHIRDGSVAVASARVEAEAVRPLVLSLGAPGRVFDTGQTVRLQLETRDDRGAPRDAVVSLWLADEGYWELAEERYPMPDQLLQLPGRPASAADSSHIVAYGADEGRMLDPVALWNQEQLPLLTRYHIWASGASLVTFSETATLPLLAQALARAAGLTGAPVVCPARAAAVGRASLVVRDVPWDLLAAQIAAKTETFASVRRGVLHLDCTEPTDLAPNVGGLGGSGTGSGYGGCSGGRNTVREQTLEGDLFFLGRVSTGPTGVRVVEVPMPAVPGRWRLQALAIDGHGRGDRRALSWATSRAVVARMGLPRSLRVGDEVQVSLDVTAPTLASQTLALRLEAEGVAVRGLPSELRLDPRGEGHLEGALSANAVGQAHLRAQLTDATGRVVDAVQNHIAVFDDMRAVPWATQLWLDEAQGEHRVTLPAMQGATQLHVQLDDGLDDAVSEALAQLAEPRWLVPGLWVDRLESFAALAGLEGRLNEAQQHEIAAGWRSTAAALQGLSTRQEGLGWWRGAPASLALTARLLSALPPRSQGWSRLWGYLRANAEAAAGPDRVYAAEALSRGDAASDRALAARLLAAAAHDETLSLALVARAVSAERTLGARRASAWPERLGRAFDATLADPQESPCGGPVWWLCMAREGTRTALIEAARALDSVGALDAPRKAQLWRWLRGHPQRGGGWVRSGEGGAWAMLLATLRGRAEEPRVRFELLSGAEGLAQFEGRAPQTVPLSGPGPLTLRWVASGPVRARVRLSASLPLADGAWVEGPVPLTRAVRLTPTPTMTLQWRLPHAVDGVTLDVPLPTGGSVARRAGASFAVLSATGGLGFTDALDLSPGSRWAEVALDEGRLHLDLGRLNAGEHTVEVPLVIEQSGRLQAGRAILQSFDGSLWGVTAPIEIAYRRPP
ncbi:MAG: hypothetical protein JNK72_02995 [Myxococcales bacterium]|nr:hypothetical protein [Myxococcales bacterium]